MVDKAEFDEFVASRSPHSLRLAFLMTRDWAETEDLQGTREAFDNREQKSMSAIAIWKVRSIRRSPWNRHRGDPWERTHIGYVRASAGRRAVAPCGVRTADRLTRP